MYIEDKPFFDGDFQDENVLGIIIDTNVPKSETGERAKPFRFVDLVLKILSLTNIPDLNRYITAQQLSDALVAAAPDLSQLATKIELGDEVNELQTSIENAVGQIIANAPDAYNNFSKIAARMAAYDLIIGSNADSDTVINNLTEVLTVFNSAPEGLNVIGEFAKKLNIADLYTGVDATVAGRPADALAVAFVYNALNNSVTYLAGEIAKKQNKLGVDNILPMSDAQYAAATKDDNIMYVII